MVLDGHVQGILSMSFSPNGYVSIHSSPPYSLQTIDAALISVTSTRYQIATGASDDTIRIWDMRSLKALYTIPAHLNNVSDVRFFRSDGAIPSWLSSAQPKSEPMNGVVPTTTTSATATSTPEPTKEGSATPAPTPSGTTTSSTADTLAQEWRYRPGLYMASAGYDGVVKLWSADDWQLLATLQTDGSKVMSVDLSSDAKLLASGTYNRNYQLFTPASAL